MSYAMSRPQCETFLAGIHVGVLAVTDPGRGPLTVPVWYDYEPGGVVRVVTGDASLKARLLRAAGRMSLCVQTETAPYQYVSVEDAVTFTTPDYERDVRGIAVRYLGPQMAEGYLAMTADERDGRVEVLLEMRPTRWRSVDYGKMRG